MGGELAPVVRGDGPHRLPVWEKQPDDGLCRGSGLAPLPQPFHDQEVGGSFRQREDGMSERVDDGVHLPVSEPLSVGLRGTQVDARPVGDVGGLGRPHAFPPPAVLEPVRRVFRQPAGGIRMDVVVNRLLADGHAVFSEHARNLRWRPVLLHHLFHAPPQFRRLAAVAGEPVLPFLALGLRVQPDILAVDF